MGSTDYAKCYLCGGPIYLEIDDRKYILAGEKRRPPTRKCLGCGYKVENCICNLPID